jgi:hypothetical protein
VKKIPIYFIKAKLCKVIAINTDGNNLLYKKYKKKIVNKGKIPL